MKNPVAKNLFRFNKPKVIPNKKKAQSKAKARKRVKF